MTYFNGWIWKKIMYIVDFASLYTVKCGLKIGCKSVLGKILLNVTSCKFSLESFLSK